MGVTRKAKNCLKLPFRFQSRVESHLVSERPPFKLKFREKSVEEEMPFYLRVSRKTLDYLRFGFKNITFFKK